MSCPTCGGRLLAKSTDSPSRLLCVACGRVLPQGGSATETNLHERRALSLLVLVALVFTPLMLLALTPWVDLRPAPRVGRQQGSERIGNHQRWDPRTGVVGRSRRF